MPELKTCPEAEDLASLIDGRISNGDRQSLLAHIDSCEECYAVFTEVARFQEENEKVVVGRFGRKGLVLGLAAAAALLFAIFQLPTLSLLLPSSPVLPDSAELLSPLLERTEAGSLRSEISISESLGFAPLPAEEAAFHLGVLTLDLEVAVRADAPLLMDLLAGAGGRVAEGQPSTRDLAPRWQGIREKLQTGVSPAGLTGDVASLESDTESAADLFHFRLGRWAEAGRLALAGDQPGYVHAPAMQQFLEAAIERVESGTEVHRQLMRIKELGKADLTQPVNQARLEQGFSDLIKLF